VKLEIDSINIDKMTPVSYNLIKIYYLFYSLSKKEGDKLPTKTFFNLPEDKKNKIISAAIKEFSDNSFSDASISSIIKKAGIPRGSFYQYFDDLKDLYKYIFGLIAEKKLSLFNNALKNFNQLKTFDLIKKLYKLGIKFARDNPQLAAIGNNFLKEDIKFKEEIYQNFEQKATTLYKNILKRGIERGEIDEKIDIKVTTLILYNLNIILADNYLEEFDPDDLPESLNEYLNTVDKMLYILENGLKKTEN